MVFIPRHPLVENQLCSYAETTVTSGSGVILAYAGSVVYVDSYGGNDKFSRDRALVKTFSTTNPSSMGAIPYGFLMQNVRVGYPTYISSYATITINEGSAEAFAELAKNSSGVVTGTKAVPVGVAQGGIWETTWYDPSVTYTAGMYLYVGEMGRVTSFTNALPLTNWIEDSVTDNRVKPVAIVERGLSSSEAASANKTLRIKLLI